MKCLVTGGAGFIGSHLVDRLVRDGHEVVVVDNLSTGRMENLEQSIDRIDFYLCDISKEYDALLSIINAARPEVIFHQAALGSVPRSIKEPEETHRVNVGGTLNILKCAKATGVCRVVAASSSSVYGDVEAGVKVESQPMNPLSPYAASKASLEMYCKAWAHTHGLWSVCLRYFNVYGPRQDPKGAYAAVIPRFIVSALTGRPLVIYGDGCQSRDFTYVDDVVEANIRAATADPPLCGMALNVGHGQSTPVVEVAWSVAELTGHKTDAVIEHVDERPGDVKHSMASFRKAQLYLGFRAQTDVTTGLGKTVDWFVVQA